MSRKHFKAMAEVIAKMEDRKSALDAAEAFAIIAKQANPKFNRQRFYDACGL